VNGFLGPGQYLELMTQSLAELANRLRHFPADGGQDIPLSASLSRLETAQALLASTQLNDEELNLLPLASALARLLTAISDTPGRDLSGLDPVLEKLAAALEQTWDDLDRGVPLTEIWGNPRWLAVLSHLETSGTALEVMDQLDAQAQLWETRWGDHDLTLAQEQELHRRWLTFRDYGDAMFSESHREAMTRQGNLRPVLLLVEGHLRREQLLQKLRSHAFDVRPLATVDQVLSYLQSDLNIGAFFCDNLEPTNHLTQVVRLLGPMASKPPLILVAGSGKSADQQSRARTLGADGLWTDPFQDHPLSGLFSAE